MSQPAAVAAIPARAVARLLANFDHFVATARKALASPGSGGAESLRWKRALGLLERDLAALQAAAKQAATGDHGALVQQAGQLRFLARRMDGYQLDFAGEAFARRLTTERRLLVLVAWQIFAAGTGSQVTGL